MNWQKTGLIFIILIVMPFYLFAQEYHDIESSNIRIDPEWVEMNEAGKFLWAFDVKADAYGNVYATGYFRESLKIDKQTIYPKCNGNNDCGDIYFLMKRNNNGKLLWMRYAIGNSRPGKIAFDSKGFIFTTGSVYSKELTFTSTGDETVKLDKANDYNSGIFICKYDTSGKVIQTHFFIEGRKEIVNDFLIDRDDNMYMGAGFEFRNYKNKAESKHSYLIMKFNQKFELQWKENGDTIGSSSIGSIALDNKSNLYATGGFGSDINFNKVKFHSKRSEQRVFVVKYNKNGGFEWASDSVGKNKFGYGNAIACDKAGNAYVFTKSSVMYLTKFNKDGKILWIQAANGSSGYSENMLIDEKDNIYLCGQGYGAVFGSKGSEVFSYKSKGSTDFFIAKYKNDGELLWLKVGGGKQTDYCNSIALYKNELFAFGFTGNEMDFKDRKLRSKSGYTLWLGKFDQKKLEYIDRNPQKPGGNNEESQLKYKVDNISCECYRALENEPGFSQSLSGIFSYDKYKEISGWKFEGDENLYGSLSVREFQSQLNSGSASYYMSIIARKPISLVHPDKTYGLNLTPCTNEKMIWELPLSIYYEHGINKYKPDFDYRTFDRHAGSYLEIVRNVAGINDDDLLNKVLFDNNITDLKSFISDVNKKYHTNIKLNEEDADASIKNIMSELEAKKISVSDFVLKEFILTDDKPHKINDIEKAKFGIIFWKYFGSFSIDDFDRNVIYPQIRASITTKNVGIEISENIIRRWDGLKNKAAKDKKGNYVKANILAEVKDLSYSTYEGVKTDFENVCLSRSEISGTGILLNFSKARPVSDGNTEDNSFDYENYPLFVKDSVIEHFGDMGIDNIKRYVYDTLLTGFSGLLIMDAIMDIPYNKTFITSERSRIILNNKLISGTIIFKTDRLSDSRSLPSRVSLISEESKIELSLEELKQIIKNTGLKDFKFYKNAGQLLMYFKKTI